MAPWQQQQLPHSSPTPQQVTVPVPHLPDGRSHRRQRRHYRHKRHQQQQQHRQELLAILTQQLCGNASAQVALGSAAGRPVAAAAKLNASAFCAYHQGQQPLNWRRLPDQQGAGIYVIVVILLYAMTIAVMIGAAMRNRSRSRTTDRQVQFFVNNLADRGSSLSRKQQVDRVRAQIAAAASAVSTGAPSSSLLVCLDDVDQF